MLVDRTNNPNRRSPQHVSGSYNNPPCRSTPPAPYPPLPLLGPSPHNTLSPIQNAVSLPLPPPMPYRYTQNLPFQSAEQSRPYQPYAQPSFPGQSAPHGGSPPFLKTWTSVQPASRWGQPEITQGGVILPMRASSTEEHGSRRDEMAGGSRGHSSGDRSRGSGDLVQGAARLPQNDMEHYYTGLCMKPHREPWRDPRRNKAPTKNSSPQSGENHNRGRSDCKLERDDIPYIRDRSRGRSKCGSNKQRAGKSCPPEKRKVVSAIVDTRGTRASDDLEQERRKKDQAREAEDDMKLVDSRLAEVSTRGGMYISRG